MAMEKGKLDNETLRRLVLGRTGAPREEVITGAGIGEDCAILDFGPYECVLSTDPITATAERIGTLAVHISCNDIAASGAQPLAILLTLLLPETVTEAEIAEIARQADEAAKALGIQIVGGHTEITDAVTQPLVSATAVGRAAAGNSKHSAGRPALGDLIIVTKQLALEGTAIAAERCAEELRSVLTDEEHARAVAMLGKISVVKEGVAAGRVGARAMHDITEGGVLGAVWEVCARAGVGAEIAAAALPFDAVTLKICAALGLDPMRLISSGSMLIVIAEEKRAALFDAFARAGADASVIGRIAERDAGVMLIQKNGGREKVAAPGPDEIYKIA
ncbi:MAG: AIR synthase family protein [Clostridiales Family XIII bacterium]|jgi:hydrogenase expression/formation protein HypE|nr:AIR synthase family protein [Clostridiales Family XIII bacterium]